MTRTINDDEVAIERRLFTPAQIEWVNQAKTNKERVRRASELKQQYVEGSA